MKKFTILESSIIGLFIGVVVATYVIFLNSAGGFVGRILSSIALLPVLDYLNFSIEKTGLYIPFLFIVVVFVLYGAIVGLLVSLSRKTATAIVSLLILLPIGILFEQIMAGPLVNLSKNTDIPMVAIVARAIPQITPIQKYFGNEARGDLNSDDKEDIAFLISRNDANRGALYYVAAALGTDEGHSGTELLFLGDKIEPKSLSIVDRKIAIEYLNHSTKNSTTTKQMFVELNDKTLRAVKNATTSNTVSTTTKQ